MCVMHDCPTYRDGANEMANWSVLADRGRVRRLSEGGTVVIDVPQVDVHRCPG